MLENVADLPVDALVEIGRLLRADTRDDIIDLGLGVYRNEHGRTVVPDVVKAAELHLFRTQQSKAYVAPDGDPVFVEAVRQILLGPESSNSAMVCVQAPGGTGALRLAMELVAHAAPGATVHLGLPSWPNHAPMLAAVGLRVATYRHYNAEAGVIDFAAMCEALDKAAPGDLALLHGCCHNPSGTDPSAAQWQELASLIARRGLVPLIDIAYQGLGDGLDADAAGVRLLLDAVPEALIASSCSKSFGLYRERVGMLLVKAPSARAAATIRSNLQSLARLNYSNPPDHGAAIVRTILAEPQHALMWRVGLEGMRLRIMGVRERLAQSKDVDLSFIRRQKGLFAVLRIEPQAIEALRCDHAVYMARSGRINLAGLNDTNIDRFVAALAATER